MFNLSLRFISRPSCRLNYQINRFNATRTKTLVQTIERTEKETQASIHATPLIKTKETAVSTQSSDEVSSTHNTQTIEWIPPKQKTSKTELLTNDGLEILPPHPDRHFSPSLSAVDARDEQLYREALDKKLSPIDIFRIPLIMNKPAVRYAVNSYLFLMVLAAILLADWDGLNEGHPHVFQSFQRGFWSYWHDYWQVDTEMALKKIKQKLDLE